MATNTRVKPNDYFAWYNSDDQLGIVERTLTSNEDEGRVAGEFDSYAGEDVSSGIRITYNGHYTPISSSLDFEMRNTNLPRSLYPALVCYIKSRLYEDLGDFQKAIYFKNMFTQRIAKHPFRKSGVRALSVPKL